MTMPKGWKPLEADNTSRTAPNFTSASSKLTAPLVDVIHIKTSYKCSIIDIFETETKKKTTLKGIDLLYKVLHKEVNLLELLPIESGYLSGDGFSLVLSNTAGPYPYLFSRFSLIPFSKIKVIDILSEREFLIKKDLLKIIFIDKDGKSITVIIDIDGNLEDAVRNLKLQKQLELDSNYWSSHLLNFENSNAKLINVIIYPFTPFLAQGETIIWQNIKNDALDKKKVILIDILTNYRIFQYDYIRHVGRAILLKSFNNATISNLRSALTVSYKGIYPLSVYSMTGTENTKTASMIGQIQFSTKDGFHLIFEDVSDPERLCTVVKKVKQDYYEQETAKLEEAELALAAKKEDNKFLDFSQIANNMKMPPISLLARPMVDTLKLGTPTYDMRIIDISEVITGNKVPLISIENDKQLNCVQLQPIESTYSLIFAIKNSKELFPFIRLNDLINLRISRIEGKFYKIQSVLLDLNAIGRDKKQYIMKIELNEKDLMDLVKLIQTQKELGSNEKYWTGYSLSIPNFDGKVKTRNIYPLTPFLAEDEEIIWQNSRTDKSIRPEPIISIDMLTNYRVLHYNYYEHSGKAILLPSLEDVEVTDEKYIPITAKTGGYARPKSDKLDLILRNTSIGNTTGDITFIYEGKPYITFTQISDPSRLANVAKALKENLSQIKIGEPIELENENSVPEQQEFKTRQQELTLKHEEQREQIGKNIRTICIKCGNKNTDNANFCSRCGNRLSPVCHRCGHSNPIESIFCSQCGAKLIESSSKKNSSLENEIVESNFLEYVNYEYHFKMNYPASWAMHDKNLPDPLLKVAFQSPKENPSDQFLEGLGIIIFDKPPGVTLMNLVEAELNNIKQKPNTVLLESVPITLSGNQAHQYVSTEGGKKSLNVITIIEDKCFYIYYLAESQKYLKFLSTAEQMISSFQFL